MLAGFLLLALYAVVSLGAAAFAAKTVLALATDDKPAKAAQYAYYTVGMIMLGMFLLAGAFSVFTHSTP